MQPRNSTKGKAPRRRPESDPDVIVDSQGEGDPMLTRAKIERFRPRDNIYGQQDRIEDFIEEFPTAHPRGDRRFD